MSKLVHVDHMGCLLDPPLELPQTNADRIRAMGNKELAQLFSNGNCGYCRIHDFCFAKGCQGDCEDVWLDWLKQEASEDFDGT